MSTLDLIELARSRPLHFMGIGGAGMAPLAELVLRWGGQITGCDSQLSATAQALRSAGAEIVVGHDPAHIQGCAALVITAAVSPDHPEVEAARRQGVPVLKRAQALGSIVNRGTVIGIAGTHGKTTTTALTTAVLAAAGYDPTGIVGGKVPAWEGNLRPGTDRLFVVEADEYDRSFLTLRPSIAVVTTLEADHLDIYGSLASIEEAFLAYAALVPAEGWVIGCADDLGVARLLPRLSLEAERVVTYGTNPGSVLRIEDVQLGGAEAKFTLREKGKRAARVVLRTPGLHNVRNAAAAAAVARALGAEWKPIVEGLASYSGVARRFEQVGEAAGVRVVDDYAHHPTEIQATLAAARSAYPDQRLIAVFQPHLYSRTRDFAEEFGRALAAADITFVTDIYAAREAPIAGVTGALIADATTRAGGTVRYLPDRDAVPAMVADALRPGDLCLTLGAGDLDAAARDILSLLDSSSVN